MKRRGRPSLVDDNPDIVPVIREFIQQNAPEAHLRRRTSVMYTNGVTLQDICNHVKMRLGITISRNTVHRLMLPHRKNTTAGKRYKGLVNARVPPKKNSGEKKRHPDFHFTCAQVFCVILS